MFPIHVHVDVVGEHAGMRLVIRPDQFNLLLLGYYEVKIGPSDRKKREKKQSIGVWL